MYNKFGTKRLSEVYDFQPNEYLLGWNSSTWMYNDDYSSMKASLIVNIKTSAVKLVFAHEKEKYGLGAGEWFTLQSIHEVGTLKKLERGKIRILLKENNNYGTPYRQKGWCNHDLKMSGLRMNELLESDIKVQRLLKIKELLKK